MFCEKCGHKLNNEKFCSNCGQETYYAEIEITSTPIPQDKWYLRLAKVVYIILYIPFPFVIWGVWVSNDPYYEDAFWYSLLTLVIWVVVLRLLKIAALYITIGQKPVWEEEFKKPF